MLRGDKYSRDILRGDRWYQEDMFEEDKYSGDMLQGGR